MKTAKEQGISPSQKRYLKRKLVSYYICVLANDSSPSLKTTKKPEDKIEVWEELRPVLIDEQKQAENKRAEKYGPLETIEDSSVVEAKKTTS